MEKVMEFPRSSRHYLVVTCVLAHLVNCPSGDLEDPSGGSDSVSGDCRIERCRDKLVARWYLSCVKGSLLPA